MQKGGGVVSKVNRGKQFEEVIKKSFEKIPDVSIDRLHDQTTGYLGSKNICDFIVYKKPYEYYIECKSIHGNTFPLSNITDNQFSGLLNKSKIKGVIAGLIIWFVDKDVTIFVEINDLKVAKDLGDKSIRFDEAYIRLQGKKKRVFFDYDMDHFFHTIEKMNRREV